MSSNALNLLRELDPARSLVVLDERARHAHRDAILSSPVRDRPGHPQESTPGELASARQIECPSNPTHRRPPQFDLLKPSARDQSSEPGRTDPVVRTIQFNTWRAPTNWAKVAN